MNATTLWKLHKTLALARHPSTPATEAAAAWMRAAELGCRLGISLDTIWVHDGKTLDALGLWPAFVDAWHDTAEAQGN